MDVALPIPSQGALGTIEKVGLKFHQLPLATEPRQLGAVPQDPVQEFGLQLRACRLFRSGRNLETASQQVARQPVQTVPSLLGGLRSSSPSQLVKNIAVILEGLPGLRQIPD